MENQKKLKSKKRICSEVSVKSPGNPRSQSWARKGRLRWEGFAEKEGFKPWMKDDDNVVIQRCLWLFCIFPTHLIVAATIPILVASIVFEYFRQRMFESCISNAYRSPNATRRARATISIAFVRSTGLRCPDEARRLSLAESPSS